MSARRSLRSSPRSLGFFGSGIVAILAVLCQSVAPINHAEAADFQLETVRPVPFRVGDYTSMEIGASNTPSIIYRRNNDLNGEIRIATKVAGVWHRSTVIDTGASFISHAYRSGLPAVSFRHALDGNLWFAASNGSTWPAVLVDATFAGQEGYYSSLAFDTFGGANIAYHESPLAGKNLKWGLSGGLPEVADGFGTNDVRGQWASIALSSADSIYIAHVGLEGGLSLRISQLHPAGWSHFAVHPTTRGKNAVSLALTATEQPAVAYHGSVFGTSVNVLIYAERLTPTSWTQEIVDTTSFTHDGRFLRFDSIGRPHIAYSKDGELWHAYKVGGVWQRERVDPIASNAFFPSLAIAAGDTLHIAYQVNTAGNIGDLRHAWGVFGSWMDEPVEGELRDEGPFIALSEDASGRSSITFYDRATGNLEMVFRDADGINWSVDDIIEVDDVGYYVATRSGTVPTNGADVICFDATATAIRPVSGTFDAWDVGSWPATAGVRGLAYDDSSGWKRAAVHDSVAGNLTLIRFGPGDTSSVLVESGGAGGSPSLAVTSDGTIHAVYYDAAGMRLRHAAWTPTGWNLVTIASGNDVGRASSLTSKSNGLHVAYYDATAGDLYYALWDGTTWTPSLVDGTGDVGRACAIGLNGPGQPRIAYHDAGNGDLMFASQDFGGMWSVTRVDSIGDIGSTCAIRVDTSTDLAGIAYYDATNGRVKFAQQQAGTVGLDPPRHVSTGAGKLFLSPNPVFAGGRVSLRIDANSQPIADVRVSDVMGRSVGPPRWGAPGRRASTWTVPQSVSGVLFFHVTMADGTVLTAKAVVMR